MSAPPSPCFRPVTHCIFDNDGTLMDTENIYFQAIQNVLKPFGKVYSFEAKLHYMGIPAEKASALMVRDYELPISAKEYLDRFDREVTRLICDVDLMPGVKDLLEHLYDYRIQMAIATSGTRKFFNLKAQKNCELMSVFRHIVCGDDPQLKDGKPAPDIFLLAASRFKPAPRPECCLVFEDSPNGLKAGLAAGMQVVFLPDARVCKDRYKGATLTLGSMAEFRPELFGLPPYDCIEKFRFG